MNTVASGAKSGKHCVVGGNVRSLVMRQQKADSQPDSSGPEMMPGGDDEGNN